MIGLSLRLTLKMWFGVDLHETNPFLIVRYFLQLHDLVVIINGLLIEMVRQEIDDVAVDIANVEYSGQLDVQDVSVVFL